MTKDFHVIVDLRWDLYIVQLVSPSLCTTGPDIRKQGGSSRELKVRYEVVRGETGVQS